MEHNLLSRAAALFVYVAMCMALVVLFAARNKSGLGAASAGDAVADVQALADIRSDGKADADTVPSPLAVVARKAALDNQRALATATH